MLIAGAVAASTLSLRAESAMVNGITAVVHDSPITFGEVMNLSLPAEQLIRQQHSFQPDTVQQKVIAARTDSREELLQRQLVLHDFRTMFGNPDQMAKIEQLIRKNVDQAIEAEIRSRHGGSRISFIRTLQAQGITLERYRQQLRDRFIINDLRQKNVSSEIIVSPHRIETYYLAHREEFKVEDEVKLRMIVLGCPSESEAPRIERLAEDILQKLKQGATFAEMATIHSEGSQRNQGGDLGWWEPSRLTKRLADTAASLQAGQYSGVLGRSAGDNHWVYQYDNGVPTLARRYEADVALKKHAMVEERRLEGASALTNLPPPIEFYLMFVEDKRPARFKTLAEVREQIEKDLQTAEQRRLEKQYVDRLEKKTFIKRF